MSDTDSDAMSHHGLSDSESECPGKSSVESASQQLGVNVCPHFFNPIQSQTPFVIGSTPSTRSERGRIL